MVSLVCAETAGQAGLQLLLGDRGLGGLPAVPHRLRLLWDGIQREMARYDPFFMRGNVSCPFSICEALKHSEALEGLYRPT